MRIALTADHAGFEMKDQLADWLQADGHEIVDLGTNGPESVVISSPVDVPSRWKSSIR